jgi:two-component system response regulator YesN
LSALFKEHQKMGIASYVREVRLERAAQLLSGDNLRVARIARLCGFASAQYFGRAFKQKYGKTPQAYRHHFPGAG